MAQYEFSCPQCPAAPTRKIRKKEVHMDANFTKDFPMKKAPSIGNTIKCVCCKRKTAIRTIPSGVSGIVRGHDNFGIDTDRQYKSRINGTDVNFTFVDHKLGDPALQRNLARFAQKQGIRETKGLENARFDPKSGRVVVDVKSNVKDPLGMIERAKRKGDMEFHTKKINTPFKMPARKAKR